MKVCRKMLLLVLLFFLTGSAPVHSPPVEIEVSRSSLPNKMFSWAYTPSVIICDYSPAKKEDVISAIKWWKELGYSFYGPYTDEYHKQKCFKENLYGTILISLVSGKNFNYDNLATTTIYSNKNTNEILWARIEIKQNGMKERVLEHEFGHALGWMHGSRVGHMMHGKLARGGWDSAGLINLD